MTALDERLYLLINGQVGRWLTFDRVMSFLANDYFVLLVLSFLLLAFWFSGTTSTQRSRFQTMVLWTVLGIALASILVKGSNLLFYRDRPFTYLDSNLLFYKPQDSSLPANSAAISFAIAAGIWLGHLKAGALALIIASVFAVSRVFAGVHFLSDVVVGAGIGALCSWCMYRFLTVVDWLPRGVIRLMRVLRLA